MRSEVAADGTSSMAQDRVPAHTVLLTLVAACVWYSRTGAQLVREAQTRSEVRVGADTSYWWLSHGLARAQTDQKKLEAPRQKSVATELLTAAGGCSAFIPVIMGPCK